MNHLSLIFIHMKKIFWTTIVRFLIIFLFRSYLRLFNHQLGREIGSRFGKCPVCVTESINTGLTDQLDMIQSQLDVITQTLQTEPSKQDVSVFQTSSSSKVALYYFNQTEDQKLSPEQQVNINSILPVYRIFPASKDLLIDTINELLKGNLTAVEKQQGFITEFPNKDFKLLSANLSSDGTLTLEFSEVPGFTDG